MDTLLTVLLYMNMIHSPGTYNLSYINQQAIDYQTSIQTIETDPVQMQAVWNSEEPLISGIVIINDNTGG